MNIPNELKYTKTHEWVKELDNGNVRIGITDFAQSELGDLVFLDLPEVGDEVTEGEAFADVESVKAASEIYSPVSGKVAAINEVLIDEPGNVNDDAYEAWLIEVSDVTVDEELLDAGAYEAILEEE